ncbi:MAG: Disulfide bond formation protein C [Candidatus Anoxychlamydiales bacterium]|nr:Disulfide bond formation protein C [Candidatus Anoxychlamydiales bacterium]NGX36705.1 Disulfide bond formation protein C [Candidatus Anoxychlamydiales bacterium]
MVKNVRRFSLYLAWLVALVATIGSLFVSEILNIKPCVFCWYQRVFMFPLVIILGIAAYKNDAKIIPYIISFPIIGALIAIAQTLLSYLNLSSLVCGLDCTQGNIKLFGFFELSIVSIVAFIVIFVLLLLAKKKSIKS